MTKLRRDCGFSAILHFAISYSSASPTLNGNNRPMMTDDHNLEHKSAVSSHSLFSLRGILNCQCDGANNPRQALRGAYEWPFKTLMLRNAFRSTLLYEHSSSATSVSTVALDSSNNSFYIGLSDGHIEEYRVDFSAAKMLHLSARKSISGKVWRYLTG